MRVSFCALCVPLLAAALPAFARARQASNSTQQAGKPVKEAKPASGNPSQNPKHKKVWTEDDMGRLNGGISVVGNNGAERAQGESRRTPSSSRRTVAWYRDQIVPLRSQLDQIQNQIRGVQSAKLGGRDNIQPALDRLESRKKDIQAKIDALEEQARKDGFEPGQLR